MKLAAHLQPASRYWPSNQFRGARPPPQSHAVIFSTSPRPACILTTSANYSFCLPASNRIYPVPFSPPSAYGMGLADIRATRQLAIEENLGVKALAAIKREGGRLGKDAMAEVAGQGVPAGQIKVIVRAHVRYAGTDTPLVVEAGTLAKMKSAFEKAHKARFGFIDRAKQLVIEAVSVEAVGGGAKFRERKHKTTRTKLPSPARTTKFFSNGQWHKAAVYTREQLSPGHKVKGPAIIIEPHQTIVLEHGWQASITVKNHLVLKRVVALQRTKAVGTKADPIMLEVFNNLFMSIAEQMGVSLQNTAYSVNIKERLDFSCAVFSADGSLVANAPHMPVHLGSMDRAVETIIRENKGKIRPGDSYLINAPYNGGTHIPDLTVCTPIFSPSLPPPLAGEGQGGGCTPEKSAAHPVLGGHRAAITPTSAASRRARCRRSPPTSKKKASTSTTSSWSTAASSARPRSTSFSPSRNIRRAIRCRTSTT